MSNLQKITCIILRNLFGLDLFSHQSCATGTLLLRKKIYPRKYSLNLRQLIFFMLLSGVLRQRTWGILLPKRTLDRLSGRPEAASSLQIYSHRITVIVNLDTLGVLRVG